MDTIIIGNIAKPQGVKGEVKVTPLTDNCDRFSKVKYLYLNEKCYNVASCRIAHNGVFLFLEGIDDRNKAEALRGLDIKIKREDAVQLPSDRYFIIDVIGSKVLIEDKIIGTLKDVLQYGSADIYVIKMLENKIAMVPAIERIILDIDVANKSIKLDKQAFEDLVVYEN